MKSVEIFGKSLMQIVTTTVSFIIGLLFKLVEIKVFGGTSGKFYSKQSNFVNTV